MNRKKSYIWLISFNVFEFILIIPYDFYSDEPRSEILDGIRILAPGLLFVSFIILSQYKKWSALRVLATFLVLLLYYVFSFGAGISSWGFAVPLVGGIGGLLIKKAIYFQDKIYNDIGKKYTMTGFLAGLIGLLLFYLTQNIPLTAGTGLGIIIVLWQLAIGYLIISVNKKGILERM